MKSIVMLSATAGFLASSATANTDQNLLSNGSFEEHIVDGG